MGVNSYVHKKGDGEMDGLISVIIPVYNIGDRLIRCVDSILKQTISHFELIIVDDGSTDDSGRICDSLSLKDSRIKVVHKSNGGVSSARNKGMDEASGEYYAFVDADDFVSADYLRHLILAEEDISIASAYYVDADGNIMSICRQEESGIHEVNPHNMKCWFDHGSMYSVWTSMFKSSLIRKYHLRFNETLTRGEDTVFMFKYIEKCKKVRFCDALIYYYAQYGKGGSSTTLLKRSNISSLDFLYRFLSAWFKKNNEYSALFESHDFWIRREMRAYLYEVMRSQKLTDKEKLDYFKFLYSLSTLKKTSCYFKGSNPLIRRIVSQKSPKLLLLSSHAYTIMKPLVSLMKG